MKKNYCPPLGGQLIFQQYQPILIHLSTLLKEKGLTIAVAESCTGGLLSYLLTELPGSSVWFERGFVTYSNASKHELLGVDPGLIEQEGAVSDAVAQAMAVGALSHSQAKVAVSITGIAGPDGGSTEKPVGTVFFGFASKDKVMSIRYFFPNSGRQQIRVLTCGQVLPGLIDFCASL